MTQFKTYEHTAVPMTDDTAWLGCIPAGYLITEIVFVNSTANEAILCAGSSSGASDIFLDQTIIANDITVIVLNRALSMLERNSLYINDDSVGADWNSSSITAIMSMRRVMI